MKTEQLRKLGLAVGQIADALWEVQDALLMDVTVEEALQYHKDVEDPCQGCECGCQDEWECDELPEDDEWKDDDEDWELEDEEPEDDDWEEEVVVDEVEEECEEEV